SRPKNRSERSPGNSPIDPPPGMNRLQGFRLSRPGESDASEPHGWGLHRGGFASLLPASGVALVTVSGTVARRGLRNTARRPPDAAISNIGIAKNRSNNKKVY